MSKTYSTALEAKVAARNKVNTIAMQHVPAMRAALVTFIGKKVQNTTGELNAKVKKALGAAVSNVDCHFWYSAPYHCLRVDFKVCECYTSSTSGRGDYSCATYAEETVLLAEIDGQGCLVRLYDEPVLRCSYTVEGVKALRVELQKARDAFDAARDAVYQFGTSDN